MGPEGWSRIAEVKGGLVFVSLVVAVTLMSCDSPPTLSGTDSLEGTSNELLSASIASQNADHTKAHLIGLDEEFFRTSRNLPGGFAGIIVEDGAKTVLLKDPSRGSAVVSELRDRALLAERDAPRIRQVEFSFAELGHAYIDFVETLEEVEGLAWTDIDERKNKLEAAFTSQSSVQEAKDLLRHLVPQSMYEISLGTPARLQKSLFNKFDTVPGGVDIGCTVGFNVDHWKHGRTFVTASHCTGELAAYDGADFDQPSGTVNPVGTEIYDESPWHGYHPVTEDYCSNSEGCRYGDVALIGYVQDRPYELGRIARPYLGTTTINSDTSRLVIKADAGEAYIYDGNPVSMVGRASGWQTGKVTDTCEAAYQQGIRFACQWRADYSSQDGDSGAPIFVDHPYYDDDQAVMLAGIHWARDGDAVFSYYGLLKWDLDADDSLDCEGVRYMGGHGCLTWGGGGGGGGGEGGGDDDCTPGDCTVQ